MATQIRQARFAKRSADQWRILNSLIVITQDEERTQAAFEFAQCFAQPRYAATFVDDVARDRHDVRFQRVRLTNDFCEELLSKLTGKVQIAQMRDR